jgi:hypothetical protein
MKRIKPIAASPLFIGICVVLMVAAAIHFAAVLHAQTAGQFPEMDKNGKPLQPRPVPFLMYSPADLKHSGVALPANGSTSPTAIVRMAGVTKLTYFMNCTQTAKLTVNVYTADDVVNPQDSALTLYGSYDVVTGITAGPQQIFIASELAPNTTNGTVSTTTSMRLPQLALSFQEGNAGATAGTCTGRLMVGYN